MTAREYLSQGSLLEQRIAGNMRRAEAMRALAASVSSPAADTVRVLSFSSGEAPFIRAVRTLALYDGDTRTGPQTICSRSYHRFGLSTRVHSTSSLDLATIANGLAHQGNVMHRGATSREARTRLDEGRTSRH